MKSPIKKKSISASNNFAKNAYAYISPLDIIQGKIEIKPEMIHAYISILDNYEEQCSQNINYKEAEIAMDKKKELKDLAKSIAKEKAIVEHAREMADVDKACKFEIDELNKGWSAKMLKFTNKSEIDRKELTDHQKADAEISANKIEEKYIIASKESNNNLMNMQKQERILVKQRKYKEAQEIREKWHQEKMELAAKQKEEVEQKKKILFAEMEIKNQKGIEDFEKKLNDEREKITGIHKKNVDIIVTKYDKIKEQLKAVQDAELYHIEVGSDQNIRVLDTQSTNPTQAFTTARKTDNSEAQKKVIMQRITKIKS
jgi:hypothetical protein